MTVAEQFVKLGQKPRQWPGSAFAFTKQALQDEFGGDWGRVPKPDYGHRIYLDPISDNFLVIRQAADSSYKGIPLAAKRVR